MSKKSTINMIDLLKGMSNYLKQLKHWFCH